MSGVYSLSTTVEITFILPKLYLKKSIKKQLNFSSSIFCSMWETEQLFIISFFTYHSGKYFSILCVLFFIIKVPYEDVLLSITTCRHLSLTCYTQKYLVKAYYYLAKTWRCVNNQTYHPQKRILSVFYSVKFPWDMWNK